MEISERIKQRRKELGISPESIADALKVSRATVYRYESNEIKKLPIDTLAPLAKILKTTPAYLMGWEYDYSQFSANAKQLVDLFYSLNVEGQEKIIVYAQDIASSGKYNAQTQVHDASFCSSADMIAYDGDVKNDRVDIIEEN